MRRQDHYLPLFLNAKMRLALIKLQAHKELGQSYAGLFALNEGLHTLNFLNDTDYEVFKKRYSDKLVGEETKKGVDVDPQAQREIESMTRYFREILSQWETHPNPEWRDKQFKKARQYANRIPYAKLVLVRQKTQFSKAS